MTAIGPNSAYRLRYYANLSKVYDAYLASGFPTADFTGQPEPERLHCRTDHDRTNWLGLLAKCNEVKALADEFGAPELMDQAGATFRCASDRRYSVSYNDAKVRLLTLLEQVEVAQNHRFDLQDEIRDAPTLEALRDIDLEAGWP